MTTETLVLAFVLKHFLMVFEKLFLNIWQINYNNCYIMANTRPIQCGLNL